MRSSSTTGGVRRLNGGAAKRAPRSRVVVALDARESRAQSPRAADLALVTFLHRLLEEATAHVGLERLLASIVQGAAHLCGARMAAISLLREDRQELEVVSVYGAPGAIHGTRLPVAVTFNGTVVTSGRALRCVARHGGHEIKAIGDRFLVEFASSLEAARCAVEIQQTLAERNARGSSERRIEVRIGLHARTGSSVSSQRGPGPRRGYDPIHAVDSGQHRRAIALDKRAPRG